MRGIDLCTCGHSESVHDAVNEMHLCGYADEKETCMCPRFIPHPQPRDMINKPPHYISASMEAIDVIEAFDLNFHLGNVCKYILRHGKKNGLEDLKKAAWYLDREIKRYNERNSK